MTQDPVTPHRDPSKIDRRVLHGLGELATPRWTRSVANCEDGLDQDDLEPVLPEEPEDVHSDSPWTIEAVDGEEEDEDEERDQVHTFFALASRLSDHAFTSLLNLNRCRGPFVLDLLSLRRVVVKRSFIHVHSSPSLLARPTPWFTALLRSMPCRLPPSPH